jgi:hypothetical protein
VVSLDGGEPEAPLVRLPHERMLKRAVNGTYSGNILPINSIITIKHLPFSRSGRNN